MVKKLHHVTKIILKFGIGTSGVPIYHAKCYVFLVSFCLLALGFQ